MDHCEIRRIIIAILIWMICKPDSLEAAETYSIQVLHHFETNSPTGIIRGSDGYFYGTAQANGSDGIGMVFKANPDGVLNPLFSFAGDIGTDPDGLVEGRDGSFYGVTTFGHGANGSVFHLASDGAFAELHIFQGPDGVRPYGRLLYAADGFLYGTTTSGGTYGYGTVFRLNPTTRVFESLYSFANTNGYQPIGGLVEVPNGDIYGSTSLGSQAGGTIFKISPGGKVTNLLSLSTGSGYGFIYVVDALDGNLYGTAAQGGEEGAGTVFRIDHEGSLTTLGSFAKTNGDFPRGLILGKDGKFYGATEKGGVQGLGTLFSVTPGGDLTTLAHFNLENGARPIRPPAAGDDGNLYGVAYRGGKFGNGTYFRLVKVPQIRIDQLPNGELLVGWDSFPGASYRLDYKPALTAKNWSTLSDLKSNGESTWFTNRSSGQTEGFFRVILVQ